MRASQFLFATTRETPSDADIASSQLMLRAGLIRKLASGLYSWLPMGLKVLQRVEAIVREEMNNAGALEIFMPMTQPAELWVESGRFEDYGPELLRFTDRHDRRFLLGPTHEEVITDIARNELQSYKQLPICMYQIQSKFRDEIRPRFGVMRAREFIMKDAYSFHLDQAGLEQTYEVMYQAYCRIFERLGLDFRAVEADTGSIGGTASHEFHVLADSGEDAIAFASGSDYAANVELAPAITTETLSAPTQPLTKVATPDMQTCEEVAAGLGVDLKKTVKCLIVQGCLPDSDRVPEDSQDAPLIMLVVRGDHELNAIKAEKLDMTAEPLTMATPEQLAAHGLAKGYIGVDCGLPMFVDSAAAALSDFVTGANEEGFHVTGMNWGRDVQMGLVADIRNAQSGDPSPNGAGTLEIKRGIEVGHIFQLGQKYSNSLSCSVQGPDGRPANLFMGCYGIGISRIVAAAIEQNHDEAGIIWPISMAPFDIAIVPLGKGDEVKEEAEALYQRMRKAGLNPLLDDRKERPGVKFADLELVGIPHRVVLSERNLVSEGGSGELEYRARTSEDKQMLSEQAVLDLVLAAKA